MKYILIYVLCFLVKANLNSQCNDNIFLNPGFEKDTIVGESITGIDWIALQGTPDLENANDSISGTGVWFTYPIPESSNGGNWQNIAFRVIGIDTIDERIGQSISFNSLVPHRLSFEFAAQVPTAFLINSSYHAAVDVIANGELIFTTEIDTTLFTWENTSFIFTPKTRETLLEFRINTSGKIERKYIALDAFCLKPLHLINFCECLDGN
jgi:hypothetical protein